MRSGRAGGTGGVLWGSHGGGVSHDGGSIVSVPRIANTAPEPSLAHGPGEQLTRLADALHDRLTASAAFTTSDSPFARRRAVSAASWQHRPQTASRCGSGWDLAGG